MKRLLRFLLSRSFLLAVLALLQIGVFIALALNFARLGTVFYTVVTIVSALCAVLVFEKTNTNPAYKMMWMLIILLMPMTGVLFYLFWGYHTFSPRIARRFSAIERRGSAVMVQDDALLERLTEWEPSMRRTAEYLVRKASAPVFTDTACAYYPFGQDFFQQFLTELQRAQKFIFMEFFIIKEGEMWDRTLAVLKEKAAQGVDVRVLYDFAGCLFTLPSGYDEELRRAGINCRVFNDIHFSWHISEYKMLNHRDHRKIAVIDGEVGFSGGMNFADEYINRKRRFGVWKDTGYMLKGPAVFQLTTSFLKMWDFVTGDETDYHLYFPRTRFASDCFVQPYGDAPMDGESVAENAYFNIIERAREYVYITTPYLILDHEMLTALCLAAKSGVDVRIITPGIPDKWYVYYVTQSYYAPLLRAGVRIYEYTPGFLHAKMYVSDDKVAIVGSANMDYRSLYLHFENCAVFYAGHMVHDVKADIAETLRQSREVTLDDVERVPLPKMLCQLLFRLFAPLM